MADLEFVTEHYPDDFTEVIEIAPVVVDPCERFDMPLLTTQTSYLGCINISLSPGAIDAQPYRDFYLRRWTRLSSGCDSYTMPVGPSSSRSPMAGCAV